MFQVFKKDMAQDIPISGIIQLVFEILFWEVTFHDCFITLMRKKIVLILFWSHHCQVYINIFWYWHIPLLGLFILVISRKGIFNIRDLFGRCVFNKEHWHRYKTMNLVRLSDLRNTTSLSYLELEFHPRLTYPFVLSLETRRGQQVKSANANRKNVFWKFWNGFWNFVT